MPKPIASKDHETSRLKALLPIIAAGAAGVVWGLPARADDGTVHIMTQNTYEGTNFIELFSAKSPGEFVAAVTTTYQNILTTNPVERAAAVAGEIAREGPDLVALQEAAILRTGPTFPATTVQFDYPSVADGRPQRTGAALRYRRHRARTRRRSAEHARFRRAADGRRRDFGEILSDNATLTNIQVHGYSTILTNDTAIGPSSSPRGWASVDVSLGGEKFRFATTHLEISQPVPQMQVQLAQMQELISSVGGTTLPLIMAGDFNANADDQGDPSFPTYKAAINAGFVDAWSAAHGEDSGYTCCQAQDLLNATSSLNQRIDLVLLRGGIGVDDIHLIGDDSAGDRTLSGLWPSDHAGVVATLEIPMGSGAVPEPSTWAMMLLGFAGLSVVGRSRISETRKSRPRPA